MQWFYAIDGKQTGPVDFPEIQRLHQTGTLTGDSLVWREGAPAWVKLSAVLDNPDSIAPVPAPTLPKERGSTNSLSIISLIFGIFGLLCCGASLVIPIVAIVCGHAGFDKALGSPGQTGKDVARAGFILGYIGLLWGIAQLVAFYGFHWVPVHYHH